MVSMDTGSSIFEAAEYCRNHFDTVILSLAQKDPNRILFLRSAQTDFNFWCSAIKATSKAKDSLDYRLRNHEDVRKAICNLLSGLKASLDKYQQVVVDSSEDQPAAPDSPSSTGSYVSWDAISEEAESQDVPTDRHNALPDANPFVAESILFITTILDQLARFSLAIRKAGNKFRFARVDKELNTNSLEFSQFRKHLTIVILRGYPDPDPEAPLKYRLGRASDLERLTVVQQRLIDANILRRHRIEYITKSRSGEYFGQLSLPKGDDLPQGSRVSKDAGGARPVSLTGSTISQRPQASSIPRLEKQMVYLAAPSATDIDSRVDFGGSPSHPVKSTVTNLTSVARTQAYPRSPESRLCPYCGDVLVLPQKEKRAAREKSWRAHVCQDVVPYTCFIEGCTTSPEPPEMFLTSEALLSHLIEKHSSIHWICDLCTSTDDVAGQSSDALIFESAESWGKHIDEEHPDLAKAHEDQRQVLADMNQQTMIGPFSCPLCNKIETPTLDFKINDHILEHLHEFALRALPADFENGRDDFGSALQSRGSTSRTTKVDSAKEKPVLAPLNNFSFGIGDIIAISDTLLKHFRGMQDLQYFHEWLQGVVDHWTSQTRVDKELSCAHLPRLQQAITVHLQQNQEANDDINESMLESVKDISDDLLDYQRKRDADWSPGETADPSAFTVKPYQRELSGAFWPVNAVPRATAQLPGRDKILDDLESKLLEQGRSLRLGNKHQPQGQLRIALEGGPSVGKTAIATELARRVQADEGCNYAIFWVDANSAESLEKSYRDIHSAIGSPKSPLTDPMHALVYYLNWELRCRWLMILDGIQERTLLYMVSRGFIPSGLKGSVLFTTRDASWRSILGPSPFTSMIKVHRIISLGDELREAYCETEGKWRNKFLPIDALDRIVTEERVKEEIEKFSKVSYDDLEQGVQHVLGTSTIAGQVTSRKKIFAILALIDKMEAISDFISEDIYDIHLPFEKEKAQGQDGARKGWPELSRKPEAGSAARIPIRAFHGWTGAQVTSFERTQWDVHVPIFFLNTEKDPKVRHYPLKENVILPFVEDDEVKLGAKMGGVADVWRVKFHSSHHNQGVLVSDKSENPSFAIRRLRCMDGKEFRREVQNLKRFSTRDYLHLIKLLGTYEWRQQYYLVFPWADGNLLDFWQGHAEPLAPKRDINTALWFSEQCLGLVEGMKIIHTWDTPDVDGHQDVFSYNTRQMHGLHGDLKPENILWFKHYGENAVKDSSSLGYFKISDFGLSRFNGTKSIADINVNDKGFSPTYRAPERDVKDEVAQSYDVWSLACVLLEFSSWYLGGYEELKTFVQMRVRDDMPYDGGYRQDRFFNLMRATQVMPEDDQEWSAICAVEKSSVVEEFDRLYDDPCCSDYLLDFLELVKKDLLKLQPDKRRGCIEIAESMRKLHTNLKKDPSYGINRVKEPLSRSSILDSVLMEAEMSPEFERQIRKSHPMRSFDWETARTSASIPAVMSSSSSSSQDSPALISMAGERRPALPERKSAFRLSRDLTTIQELPSTQEQEELDKEYLSHQDATATASENAAHADGRALSTGIPPRLNIIDNEASQPAIDAGTTFETGEARRPSPPI